MCRLKRGVATFRREFLYILFLRRAACTHARNAFSVNHCANTVCKLISWMCSFCCCIWWCILQHCAKAKVWSDAKLLCGCRMGKGLQNCLKRIFKCSMLSHSILNWAIKCMTNAAGKCKCAYTMWCALSAISTSIHLKIENIFVYEYMESAVAYGSVRAAHSTVPQHNIC